MVPVEIIFILNGGLDYATGSMIFFLVLHYLFRFSCWIHSSPIFTAFGFVDEFYYVYSTNLWRNAPVIGDDPSWVLAATTFDDESRSVTDTASAGTRSVNCRKLATSTVSFLPSSFTLPSLQQIWLCLPHSNKRRSERGSNAPLNKWNGHLSMLTLIMDSGANMCLFNNKSLHESLNNSLFNKKTIHGVNKDKDCSLKGSLSSKLGNLPLPKDNYYYNPNVMANLLLLALISKTNRVYMDTAIDNAFYVFDEEGKYLSFHLFQRTNLYRLDIEQTEKGGCIFTTVTGCETTEQRTSALEDLGMSQLDYNRAEKV